MGKSTISTGPFSIDMFKYQRVDRLLGEQNLGEFGRTGAQQLGANDHPKLAMNQYLAWGYHANVSSLSKSFNSQKPQNNYTGS